MVQTQNAASAGEGPKAEVAGAETAIMVAVRVRPFSEKEKAQLPRETSRQFVPTARNFINCEDEMEEDEEGGAPARTLRKVVHTIDDHVLVFDPPDENDPQQAPVGASNRRRKDIRFVFDGVYGEEATQRDVYEGTTRGLLDAVMGGYNATVFAYGATGCGKTYTISGSAEDPGIIFLTMQELYARVAAVSDERAVDVTMTYLEVYNETIRDLLAPTDTKGGLALREDARLGVTVAGLSQHAPQGVGDVMALAARGGANRTMSATEANAVSSRSHAVMQVHVAQRARAGGLQTDVTTATLSIIDLAGSERATVAPRAGGSCGGARQREGANINRSLLALANCINALCDARTRRHVPYRDSKLTRLLKFSLGGNCRTVMITCVSPASTYFEETHNTLKYADRAKRIRTTVARNTHSARVHVAQYQDKIREQSAEIRRLQAALASARQATAAGGNSSAGGSGRSGAQAAADVRRQTQAAQAVQDIRNRLAAAYAPVRDATWDQASAQTVGRWFDASADSLRAWRAQFETLLQEHQHLHAPSQSDDDDAATAELVRRAQTFRHQADDLLRDLARERKTVARHAEHAAQLIERNTHAAERAARVPPGAMLTAEQRFQVDQEHSVLSLRAERCGLRRQAALGEHVAQTMAEQNSALLRLTATCLFSLKRAIHDVQQAPAADGVVRALDQIYLQAIASFGEATGAVRASMQLVRDAGGPSKMVVDGSSVLTPPSPFVQRNAASAFHAASANSGANAAAVSAAVAGTTRARRATMLPPTATSAANSNAASSALGVVLGRGMRVSPPKRSQAILGRPAARPPVPPSSTAAGSGSGAPAAEARRARRVSRVGAGGGGASHKPHARAGGARPGATDADTLSHALRTTATVTSPPTPMRKASDAMADSASSLSLPSPSSTVGSASPASSVASWASASSSSPMHEPLPAEARPLKGILKQPTASGAGDAVRAKSAAAVAMGPIRLGNERRRSRSARVKANPTSRAFSGSSPRPVAPQLISTAAASNSAVAGASGASIRELSFKSVGGSTSKKPPAWR
ncbi:tubulin-dependent ATPase kip3 [Coemansia sp. RSA 1939]|nr:tubulin-dependent ATPase kip3 [Coemansia sp. RSA 1939]KAJ2615714.1 tubulin-dependent ATPase kip3 [Coemansia sp. RSA 1804]